VAEEEEQPDVTSQHSKHTFACVQLVYWICLAAGPQLHLLQLLLPDFFSL